MRPSLLTVILVASGVAAVPVAGGTPQSDAASNIGPGDAASTIAPRLPTPPSGDDATVRQYLLDARQALAAGRTGAAQEALERAETRVLDRAVPPSRVHDPSRSPLVGQVAAARQALGAHDPNRALQILDAALSIPPNVPPGSPYVAVPPPRPEPIPPPPGARYVWLPGHWLWSSTTYVWVPGRYAVAPAPTMHFIPGHWELRGGGWVWVQPHWA